MPRRERPEPPERDYSWRQVFVRARSFDGGEDLRLIHPVKDEDKDIPGRASSDTREHADWPLLRKRGA
jgi:hypothetical protein